MRNTTWPSSKREYDGTRENKENRVTRFRATSKPPVHPSGEWLRISHEMTWEMEEIADRDDIIVKFAPDAGYDDSAFDEHGELLRDEEGNPRGQQHPGVTFPGLGITEINPAYLPEGVAPEDMSPLVRRDHARYPVIWGLLTHEGAHAHFSEWLSIMDDRIQDGEITDEQHHHLGAATILEESRIEKRQMAFRPQDQVWLQASGTQLALEEVSAQAAATREHMKENPDAQLDKALVARAAALVLARIDAGSVIPDKATQEIQSLVSEAFGKKAPELRRIWREAQHAADDDADAMMALGKKWYELTGDDGGHSGEEELAIAAEGGEGEGDGNSLADRLKQALHEAAQNSRREASGENERERRQRRIAQAVDKRRLEGARQQEAKRQARGLLAGTGSNMSHPVTGYRDPSPQELTLARTTRKQLEAAYLPERAVTRVTRVLPPGRLSMRAAQQQDAQLRAGLIPDAEPFTHKDRTHVPTPPLKVGIVQDVSGSQGQAANAAVSGAWSLAKAALMIADAEVAMVSFGDRVNAIIKPRERLKQVPVIQTPYGTDYFCDALQALEGMLDLMHPGTARLVVVLTDGHFSSRDTRDRDASLRRLTETGVKILWMDTDGNGTAVPAKTPGLHIFTKASGNYAIIPKVINTEAVNALKK